jgi:adsorption protein B
MGPVDRLIAGMLVPFAMWVLASGLDDLFLDLCSLYFRAADRWRLRGRASPVPEAAAEKRIALLIPAWREAGVIEKMLGHNLAAIQYGNYEIFVGVYPNDLPTLTRVLACGRLMPRVHHVLCRHEGPTSKADCLNALYQGILLHEEQSGRRFDVILQHDAEDLIHPESLAWVNRYINYYDMVQVPVLPLATPLRDLTHGVYCDDFALSHLRDLHVRQRLGGFLPSCGVGTAYRRSTLDRLAWNRQGQPFDVYSLTEDYHTGLDLHLLGCSQILLDACELGNERGPGATREYFPRRFASAVRQRSRWITGIALQSWQKIGWDAGPGQLYWLWRDRKGLLGNVSSLAANVIFLYGAGTWLASQATGQPWRLGDEISGLPWLKPLLIANTTLIVLREWTRACWTRKIYGWRHALLAPVRTPWANCINFAATMRAIALFTAAQVRRRPLAWLKTDHRYPTYEGLTPHKRKLGEVLAEMELARREAVQEALASLQPGERLGECLVRCGVLTEPEVYRGLAAQQSLPFEPVDAHLVSGPALERMPLRFAHRLGVLPMRVVHERYLYVATAELPTDAVSESIVRMTGLEPRFQLITPSNYRTLTETLGRTYGSKGHREPQVWPPST